MCSEEVVVVRTWIKLPMLTERLESTQTPKVIKPPSVFLLLNQMMRLVMPIMRHS